VFLNLRDVLVLVLGAQGGKYEYKYSGFVLEYNSSTSTSTRYYISGNPAKAVAVTLIMLMHGI